MGQAESQPQAGGVNGGSDASGEGSTHSALHVLRVAENSPAAEAGIEPFFDFVVGAGGQQIVRCALVVARHKSDGCGGARLTTSIPPTGRRDRFPDRSARRERRCRGTAADLQHEAERDSRCVAGSCLLGSELFFVPSTADAERCTFDCRGLCDPFAELVLGCSTRRRGRHGGWAAVPARTQPPCLQPAVRARPGETSVIQSHTFLRPLT
jgi:hypothetical protein